MKHYFVKSIFPDSLYKVILALYPVCFFEHTRVYPPLLCILSMEPIMCTKEFDSEMRNDCRCERCRLNTSVDKVEKKFSLLADEYNKISKLYHNHLGKIYDKVGVKSWRIKIDNNYDEKSKSLYSKMKDLDKMLDRQRWRLTSLERKLELIDEDDYYSEQYA